MHERMVSSPFTHNQAEGHQRIQHAHLLVHCTRVQFPAFQLATWLTASATAPDCDAVVPRARGAAGLHALRASGRHVELLCHLCRDGPEGVQLAGDHSRKDFTALFCR